MNLSGNHQAIPNEMRASRERTLWLVLIGLAVLACGFWATVELWGPASPSPAPKAGTALHNEIASMPSPDAMDSGNDRDASVATGIDLTQRLKTARFEDLLAMLQEKLASGSKDDVLALLEQISESRPAVAVELAHDVGRTLEERSLWVSDLTRSWAARAPEEALQWFTRLSSIDSERLANGSLLPVILGEMAARDPELLLRHTNERLRAGPQSKGIAPALMASTALNALIKNGRMDFAREAVEDWARSPLPFDIGAAAFTAVAVQMLQTSPDSAGEWLRSLPHSEQRNVALGTLASTWVGRDPQTALSWAWKLSPAEGRPETIRRAFCEWMEMDSPKAVEWLNAHRSELPAGPKTDEMVLSVVGLSPIAREDPQGALEWASLVVTPDLRALAFQRVIDNWARVDPVLAARYLSQSSEFSSAQKNFFLHSIANRKTGIDSD